MKMKIGKWVNSLAVRLPKKVVDRHNLEQGDALDSRAFERIKALRRPLPPDWKFDRDEANSR